MSIARPAATITLRADSVGGLGGIGGAAGAALGAAGPGGMGMDAAAVARLRVDLGVDEAHDSAELTLWPGSTLAGADPASRITISLDGGDGTSTKVLSAEVAAVEATPGATVLIALAPSAKLSSAHIGRSWRQTTLGQVVRDLLSDGGVDAGDIDATLSLPTLHVDPRRSVWQALHDLARRTGHQVTSTADGAVSFTPAPGASGSAELREGAELIAYAASQGQARPTLPRVSPAGTQAAYLLEAKPDDGTTVAILDPTLRTREAADAGTDAAKASASRRARQAGVRVPGQPGIRPGTTITARDENYRVTALRHTIDPSGFVTDLTLEADR